MATCNMWCLHHGDLQSAPHAAWHMAWNMEPSHDKPSEASVSSLLVLQQRPMLVEKA